MKNIFLIILFFLSFNIHSQSLEESIFKVLDVFIEKEIDERELDRDSVFFNLILKEYEDDYLLQIDIFDFDAIRESKNIDILFTYNGTKSAFIFKTHSDSLNYYLSKRFVSYDIKNIDFIETNFKIYEPFTITLQINKENEVLIMSSIDDEYYLKELKNKIKFSEDFKFAKNLDNK